MDEAAAVRRSGGEGTALSRLWLLFFFYMLFFFSCFLSPSVLLANVHESVHPFTHSDALLFPCLLSGVISSSMCFGSLHDFHFPRRRRYGRHRERV